MREWLRKSWMWLAGVTGGLVLFVSIYFAGSAKRKGQVELEVAKHELEKANKQYDVAVKKTAEIQETKKRLVADILSEQLRRAEELKRTKGLSDEEVVRALRERGDITDDGN